MLPTARRAQQTTTEQQPTTDRAGWADPDPGPGQPTHQPQLFAVPLVCAHLVLGRRRFPGRHPSARLQAGDIPLERIGIGRVRRVFWRAPTIRAGVGGFPAGPVRVGGIIFRMVAAPGAVPSWLGCGLSLSSGLIVSMLIILEGSRDG